MNCWALIVLCWLPLLLADSSSSSSSSRVLRSTPGVGAAFPAQYDASVTQDVVRLYTKMKIDMEYARIAGSTDDLSWFTSDITQWLRSIASDPTYIQGTGVERVSPGSNSVILVAFIQFRPGTPLSVVQTTTTSLTANMASLYASSNLPATWGKLLGSTVAQNAADLTDVDSFPLAIESLPGAAYKPAAAAAAADPTSNTPRSTAGDSISPTSSAETAGATPAKQGGSGMSLGKGAIAGITIAGVAVIAVSGFVLSRTLADKERKKHDIDITAKLDYVTELREADLDGAEDQQQPGGGSTGSRHLWSWLKKADTPQPTPSQLASKDVRSAAASRASTLTTHGSGSCIAATPGAGLADTKPRHTEPDTVILSMPQGDVLSTQPNTCTSQGNRMSATDTPPVHAVATVPSTTCNTSDVGDVMKRHTSTDLPAAAVPAPATLKLRRTSSASEASRSSGGGKSSGGGVARAH